jgi:hypothetical protein
MEGWTMLMPSHCQKFFTILKLQWQIWGKHNTHFHDNVILHTFILYFCCRTLDLEAQYTINPSRAAEITIADTVPGKGSSKRYIELAL